MFVFIGYNEWLFGGEEGGCYLMFLVTLLEGRRDSYYDVCLFSFYSSSSYDTTSHTS